MYIYVCCMCVLRSLKVLRRTVLTSFSVLVEELSLSIFVHVKQHSDLAGLFPWNSGGWGDCISTKWKQWKVHGFCRLRENVVHQHFETMYVCVCQRSFKGLFHTMTSFCMETFLMCRFFSSILQSTFVAICLISINRFCICMQIL